MPGTSEALESHMGHNNPRQPQTLRLGREERDHIADHALDSIGRCAGTLVEVVKPGNELFAGENGGSDNARKIAALSNLLGDIGWEREGLHPFNTPTDKADEVWWQLGELFPVAQLRPWLGEWTVQDNDAARICEEAVEANHPAEADRALREMMVKSREKLGTGAILLARIEKWMASHEN